MGSKCSLNQVNLSSNLADNLNLDSSYRPVTCTYLPKPPPTGRDILSLEQRLAVLSMPVSKISRSKSSSANPGYPNHGLHSTLDGSLIAQTYRARKSKTPISTDEVTTRGSRKGSKFQNGNFSRVESGNISNGTSIVELMVPKIALPLNLRRRQFMSVCIDRTMCQLILGGLEER